MNTDGKYYAIIVCTFIVIFGIGVSVESYMEKKVQLAKIEATKIANQEELNKRLEAIEKLMAKHDKDLKELNAVFNAGD